MTYPTFTRKQLVSRAYAILGMSEVGQSEDAESLKVIDAFVIPLLARLNAEKITYHVDGEGDVTQLDDPEAIPAKAFIDVAVLLAYDAMGDFGMASLPPPHDATKSEKRLRTVWSVGASQEEYEEEVIDLDTDEVSIVTRRRNITLQGEFF